MAASKKLVKANINMTDVIYRVARFPGVRIDREDYLRHAFGRYCTPDQVERVVAAGPSSAGISEKIISAAAKSSIRYETIKVTSVSALAGIPGGLAMLGTVPADLAQLYAHMLRVAQKLAYIYDWPDLFDVDGDEEAVQNLLVLFMGAMFGIKTANQGIAQVMERVSRSVTGTLPEKALAEGVIATIANKVAKTLGMKIPEESIKRGVAKAVPVISAAISGGVTFSAFYPMSRRLQKDLIDIQQLRQESRWAEWDQRARSGPAGEDDGAGAGVDPRRQANSTLRPDPGTQGSQTYRGVYGEQLILDAEIVED
ncbi:hypothetical protein [Schaalia sp. ZJ1691]|uniref:hypothetical protein n=1 Tax=Schaalia sp. ZJ1691 TaxID=2709404 RepID=UPI0013EA564A|nr:hypothetical protein [Schaalia sp. ZJ1691]